MSLKVNLKNFSVVESKKSLKKALLINERNKKALSIKERNKKALSVKERIFQW
jgi:hypothetical protein